MGHDLADVSAYLGDGKNNGIPDDIRGAIYHGIYQISNHKLMTTVTEDNDYVEYDDGYVLTSGRFDGSEADDIDSNDAKVWFKITDDYQPMSNVRIINPGDGTKHYTKQKINFIVQVESGMAPYTYLWNFGDGSTSNKENPMKSYDSTDTYRVNVKVTDVTGKTVQSSQIRIKINQNKGPEKPDKPAGDKKCQMGKSYDYKTFAIDFEKDKVEFGWDWDGDNVVDVWDDNNGEYYYQSQEVTRTKTWGDSGNYRVKVMARDECGYESEWSDELNVVVSKIRTVDLKSLISQFTEKFLQKFPILEQLMEL